MNYHDLQSTFTITNACYNFFITLFILNAAIGLGYLLLRGIRLPITNQLEYFWFMLVIGLGGLSLVTLLLGLLGLLIYPLLRIMLAGFAVFGFWMQAHYLLRAIRFRQISASIRIEGMYILIYGLLCLGGSAAVYALLVHALTPPLEWDELAYQLTLPLLYLKAGQVYYIPHILHSNWPMNTNMLFLLAIANGSDTATHLIMFTITLLLAAGCVIFAAAIDDIRIGWIAAALTLLVPLTWRLAGTAIVDLAPALPALAAFLALLRWQQTQQWQWVVLSGWCSGLAAGSKLMAGAFIGLIGLLMVLHLLQLWHNKLRTIVLFASAALIAVGLWYIRSWWYTGNPVWPLLYPLLGGRDWDMIGHIYLMQVLTKDVFVQQFPITFYGLLSAYTTIFTAPETMDLFERGYGTLIPAGVLLAVLLAPRGPNWLWQCLLVAGGWYLIWFLLLSHQLRFLLPGIAFAALPTGYVLVWLYTKLASFLRSMAWLRTILLTTYVSVIWWWAATTLPWTDTAARHLYERRLPYLRGQMTEAALVQSVMPTLPALLYINTYTHPDARILMLPSEPRVYYLERDFLWGNIVSQRVVRFEQYGDAASLVAALQTTYGITHFLYYPWKPFGLPYEDHYYDLIQDMRDRCSTLLFSTPFQNLVIEVRRLEPCTNNPK